VKVKCGREEFDVNSKDIVMYNGSCYQLTTKRTGKHWHEWPPVIAKARARKMIKDGVLTLTKEHHGMGLQYYNFKEIAQ